MLYVSIVFVLLFWTFVFAVFYFYSKFSYSRKLNLKTHYVFEDIPTIFDLCNGFNANEIYLLRIIYGDRNKRFFLPSATITVKFLDSDEKCLSSININSSILTDNHRRFLGIKKKPKLLYVLIKRAHQLTNLCYIGLDHNIPGGVIAVYSAMLLNLKTKLVYGSKIGKSINCLKQGFSTEVQRFILPLYGSCDDYVGPSTNFFIVDILYIYFFNLCFLLVYSIYFVYCIKKLSVQCFYYENISQVYKASMIGGTLATVLSILMLLINRFVFKQLNTILKDVGCIWLFNEMKPLIVWFFCFTTGVYTIIVLITSYGSDTDFDKHQKIYWIISLSISICLYTLSLVFIFQVLYLFGLYDDQILPFIDLESESFKPPPTQEDDPKLLTKEESTKSLSTKNLYISSNLVSNEKYSSQINDAASISKIIDQTYQTTNQTTKKSNSKN